MTLMEEIVGKLTVRMMLYKRVENGGVFVYRIENDDNNNDIYFGNFYIATFDDLHSEEVWGVGYSIESALENAMKEWDRGEGDDCQNPFREVLEKLKKDKNT